MERPDGAMEPLAALTGARPAILHFWATWCAPCVVELPQLAAFAEAHPALGAQITVISIDRRPIAEVTEFLRDLGLTLDTVRLAEGNAGTVYGLKAYPSTVFVDAHGTPVRVITGSVPWNAPATVAAIGSHLAAGATD